VSTVRLAAVGGLLFLVLLIASAPAHLLGALISAERVVLSGYAGTLWRGSAARVLVATPGGWFHLGRVNWSLKPWSLLLFAPRLDIDASWGRQHIAGEIALAGGDAVTLREFEASLDASLVQELAPLALDGLLTANFALLEVDAGLVTQAQGRLVWERASWLSPRGPVPLGSYAMELGVPQGRAVQGMIVTVSGPVTAEGRIQLDGRSYGVELAIGSEGAMDPQLQQALSLVARPVATGYQLNLEGEL
jgi:hypothetical protein